MFVTCTRKSLLSCRCLFSQMRPALKAAVYPGHAGYICINAPKSVHHNYSRLTTYLIEQLPLPFVGSG